MYAGIHIQDFNENETTGQWLKRRLEGWGQAPIGGPDEHPPAIAIYSPVFSTID